MRLNFQGRPTPIIETPRLILRAHSQLDYLECVAMWSDPLVTRYTIGGPSPAHKTWLRILAYQGLWSLLGFGYWAIEEKASGCFIGEVGFADFKRDNYPKIVGVPELGWALAVHAHNKGFASEALQAVTEWGDQNLNSDRTVCLIFLENSASLRVAEKAGFREIERVGKNDQIEILLERKGLFS